MQMAKCLECLLLLLLTHFLAKTIFSEGMGGVQNSSGNFVGVGGGVILLVKKMEILGRGGLT